jgi:hypothetical protein
MLNPEFKTPVEQPLIPNNIPEKEHETPAQLEKLVPISPDAVIDKYGPEAIKEQIKDQAELIHTWAAENGLENGKDYRIIESIEEVIGEGASVAPHEHKQFFVIIHEDKYRQFKDYFTDKYRDEMKQRDPKNDARLAYSWGGRFLVGWAGVPFDTVAVSNIDTMTTPTHHEEFKKFFRDKTGFDFPTAETLNPQLKEMSKKGLSTYQEALFKLREMKEAQSFPPDGYGLIDSMVHAVELLEQASSTNAVEELPEVLQCTMPREMRTYADLTYNAEAIANLDRVREITGISIPDETRIDKIFERFGFNRNRMEEICKDFSDYIMTKKNM